jgi:chemotaxis protein CheD
MPGDRGHGPTIHVPQGRFDVSADPGAMMTTVLGSCVAACLHDAQAGVGGMTHFLLPDDGDGAGRQILHGAQAMESLINGLLKLGGRKDRLTAKLFGGARMLDGLSDIGAQNAAFAVRFLLDEDIPLLSRSLGETRARRVRFWPASGRAAVMHVRRDEVPTPIPPPPFVPDIVQF